MIDCEEFNDFAPIEMMCPLEKKKWELPADPDYWEKYRHSEKFKAYQREYKKTEKAKDYARRYQSFRYRTDPEYRKRMNKSHQRYEKKKYHEDEKFRAKRLESSRKYHQRLKLLPYIGDSFS